MFVILWLGLEPISCVSGSSGYAEPTERAQLELSYENASQFFSRSPRQTPQILANFSRTRFRRLEAMIQPCYSRMRVATLSDI